jgi:hypothetical protein
MLSAGIATRHSHHHHHVREAEGARLRTTTVCEIRPPDSTEGETPDIDHTPPPVYTAA